MSKVRFSRVPTPIEDIVVRSGAHYYEVEYVRHERGSFLVEPPYYQWSRLTPANPDDDDLTIYLSGTIYSRTRLKRDHIDELIEQKDKLTNKQIAQLTALVLTGEVK